MSSRLKIILLGVGTSLLAVNHFFLDDFVRDAFLNRNPIIEYFYPRFGLEKHRLSLAFFTEKKDQVIFRILILIGGIILLKKLPKFSTEPITSIESNIKAYFLCIGIFTAAWLRDIPDLINMSLIYEPVKILNLLSLGRPSFAGLSILFSLTAVGSLYSVIKTNRFIALLSFIGFILVQAIFSSYQKIDHGFTSLIYLGFAFCLFVFRKKELQKSSTMATLIVSLCYFQAGLEKILISKLELFNPENILVHLANHPTIVSDWIGNYPTLAETLFLLVILFQVSFPILLFYPKLKKLYIWGGIGFHLGVYFFLNVGWWVSPWSVALLLLLDWTPVLEKLKLARKKYTNIGI